MDTITLLFLYSQCKDKELSKKALYIDIINLFPVKVGFNLLRLSGLL